MKILNFSFSPIRFFTIIILLYIIIINRDNLKYSRNIIIINTVIWLLYGILNVTRAIYFESWLSIGFTLLLIMMWLFILLNIKDLHTNHTMKWIVRSYFITFIVHLIIGYYEMINKKLIFHEDIYAIYSLFFPTSTFYNINDYATYLSFSLLFVGYMYIKTSKYILKLMLVILGFLDIYLIYTLDSRLNIILSIFYVGILVVLKLKEKITIKTVFISITLIGLTFLIVNFLVDEINNRSIHEVQSDIVRWNLIKNGMYFLYLSGGLGIGVGNASYYLQMYSIYPIEGIAAFHNFFLEYLTTNGVVVTILFLITYIYILVNSWRIYKIHKSDFSLIIFIYFLCFFISTSASSSVMTIEWNWLFFIMALVYILKTKKETKNIYF